MSEETKTETPETETKAETEAAAAEPEPKSDPEPEPKAEPKPKPKAKSVPPRKAAGWSQLVPTGINDRGWITGYGYRGPSYNNVSFVLMPK